MANERKQKQQKREKWIVIGCGLLYGGIGRASFALEPLHKWLGGAATASFLFLIPFAMGSLVAFLGMTISDRKMLKWSLGMPSLVMGVGILASLLTGLEATFCLVVATPIMWPLCVLGAWITALIMRRLNKGRTYVTVVGLLPYLVAPIEQAIELPEKRLEIHNTVEIDASPEEVWREIASVREIQRSELPQSWIYMLGFPRPKAAVLDREGVGGIRIATFERNVSFFERVTEWKQNERLAFSIEADPAFVPANAFDQHIIVGGRFYDVLDGCYAIEPLGPQRVRLHLSSRHRLNSHFHAYAGWWSEKVMDQIQTTILGVIRNRAESGNDPT